MRSQSRVFYMPALSSSGDGTCCTRNTPPLLHSLSRNFVSCYNALNLDLDEVMQMGGSKATEEEIRALVAGGSGVLSKLELPEYEPTEPPNSLDTVDKSTWKDQDRFLIAFSKCRQKATAARAVGIGRSTIYWWEGKDHLGFKDRLKEADEVFLNDLENLALDRVRQQQPGHNPTLLITLLNANLPDKYRPNSVAPSETMTETLQAMKKATREFRLMEDGSETTTETETTVIVKKGVV